MIYVGIDFSLNSPGICIKDRDGEYTFVSFYNDNGRDPTKPTLKAFQTHKTLVNENALIINTYNRNVNSKDFLTREREKIIDATQIANQIVNFINNLYPQESVKISLEGFSYGSKGNSFIDIVQYNSFLRNLLAKVYGADSIYVFQPSHVKKIAGKGNANKHYMVKSFQDNILNDDKLKQSKLWKWCKDKDFSEKIPKPIDDLVDGYFLVQTIINYKRELKTLIT
jgi:hypothetical protein